ncbi:MAG: hypothetical protein U0M41_09065 [Negativibacillus sp.]|nr:hypothetical protein [Negativibacillus sp.]
MNRPQKGVCPAKSQTTPTADECRRSGFRARCCRRFGRVFAVNQGRLCGRGGKVG